jgi:hypothetical protein
MENDIKPTPHSESNEAPKVDETSHTDHAAVKSHAAEPEKRSMATDLKKAFLFVLVGGLVLSAAISVVAVLFGEFNEVTWRALGTTISIVMHALFALLFFSMTGESQNKKANDIYINTIMGVIVASFATSVFALWEVMTGRIVSDLYGVYFYTFVFSSLARMLYGAVRSDKTTRILADVSIAFTALMYVLVLPPLFYHYPDALPDFYYRVLAAVGIVLGTTSVLTAIFNRLYWNKHPEVAAKHEKSGSKSPVNVILVIVAVIFGFPLLMMLLSWASYSNSN